MSKIKQLNPYLKFNGDCQEAISLYTQALNAKVNAIMRWSELPDTPPEYGHNVMFSCLDVGPNTLMLSDIPFGQTIESGDNNAVHLDFEDLQSMIDCFESLAKDGDVTMPIESMHWGAKFGALTDRFGVSWQFHCIEQPTKEWESTAKVRTCLWFDNQGEEAAEFYVSLIPNSHIQSISRPGPDQTALAIEFTICEAPYMILNGGPHFNHSPAASISVLTKDQEETDQLWDKLLANGGKEGQCGWIIDKFGVSWQVVPEALAQCMSSSDKEAATRAQQAMMQMTKINIEELFKAFAGEENR